jgi:hypothetical protein
MILSTIAKYKMDLNTTGTTFSPSQRAGEHRGMLACEPNPLIIPKSIEMNALSFFKTNAYFWRLKNQSVNRHKI